MIRVKEWFESKMEQELMVGGTKPYIISIDLTGKESEKAVLAFVEYGFCSSLERTKTMWIPKSCIITEEQYQEEIEKENQRFENGLAYNMVLVAFAKAHSVKGVRKGMKTTTLIEKIEAAGLTVPARA